MKHAVLRIGLMILLGTGVVIFSGCSFSSPLKGEESLSSAFLAGEETGSGREERHTQEETADEAEDSTKANTTEDTGMTDIFVHVCGCVKNPGLYRLPLGARVQEAVDAAGGFTKKADQNAKNLAEVLEDGTQIYIPSKAETADQTADSQSASGQASQNSGSLGGETLVNINTASQSELLTLPGIGETRAAAILACREEKGTFASIEEIKDANGIGEGIFNQIKDLITVD